MTQSYNSTLKYTPEKCKDISCAPKDMDGHNDSNIIHKQTASNTYVIKRRAHEWVCVAIFMSTDKPQCNGEEMKPGTKEYNIAWIHLY